MSELQDIFNAFNDYEDAQQAYIFEEVNYNIKNNDFATRKNVSKTIKLGKTRMKLFDKIQKFVSASQNRMTQNRMTQNKMTQNNPNLTIIERRRQNETQRKEKQSKEKQSKEKQRRVRFNNSSTLKVNSSTRKTEL
jgi:hypothetical protein